jgi:ankyrin repeat protein
MLRHTISIAFFICLLSGCFLHAQESVCDVFNDLETRDGSQLIVAGELIISKDFAALGAFDCDNTYKTALGGNIFQQWPTAFRLRPSPSLPAKQLHRFESAALKADKLRQEGKIVTATASLVGRLNLKNAGNLPAEFTFDSIQDLDVEALSDPGTLPVISICELFDNLPKWRGMRIAVRGEGVSTFEGSWIVGRCKGSFYTSGYRWPVALDYAVPAYYSQEIARFIEPKRSPSASISQKWRGMHDVTTTSTYVGRLRMRKDYTAVCDERGEWVTNGFGHLNGATAELIVEAVLDTEVTPRVPEGDEPRENQGCEPSNFKELCANTMSLVNAAHLGCLDQVRNLLLRNGIDSKNRSESPALSAAIRRGNADIVHILLDSGAPVNPTTIADSPPLAEAGWWGQIEIMKLLLKAGADVNGVDHDGRTYLVSYGYFDPKVARLLLENGANPNATDEHGQTALMMASMHGYAEVVRLLITHEANVNAKDNSGSTALMHAAAGEFVDAIPLLLENGADPYEKGRNGNTALHVAKKSGNKVAVELLSSAAGAR